MTPSSQENPRLNLPEGPVAGGGNHQISKSITHQISPPFTTKADLVRDQAAHPPYGSRLTEPLSRYTRCCHTSGTTTAPLAILDTPASWQVMLDAWAVIYAAGGITAAERLYFAFSFGPFLGFWTAWEAGLQMGALCLPGGGLSSAARLAAIAQHRATVLLCTPTYALHLARGIDLAGTSIRKIIVAGEPGGSVAAVRARIAAAWHGAEVLDHYGLTETGPVACQQAGEPGFLRLIPGHFHAEVIDPSSGQPAREGELVLTNLLRLANPLVRYRTGDLVRLSPSGDRFEGGILGRLDDMVVIRGVNLYPSAVDAVVRTLPEIGEYRVTITARGDLREVQVEAECAPAVAAALERAFSEVFTLRIPVTPVAAGTLPAWEMKSRRWVADYASFASPAT